MSKINKNKIIGSIFIVISIILIFLSFQKTSTELEVENKKDISTNISSVFEESDKEDSDLSNEEKINEKTSEIIIEENITANEDRKETNYIYYDLIFDSEKINGFFVEGDSLYDSLSRMKKEGTISFEDKNFSGLGAYIYSINGISENKKEGKYWIYYINGKEANIGVSNYLLNKEDEIRWQLENNTY